MAKASQPVKRVAAALLRVAGIDMAEDCPAARGLDL
jgi:hypothetical protein